MRWLQAVAAVALSVVLVGACAAASAAFPTGKWVATISPYVGVMEYRPDGTWTYSGGPSLDAVQAEASGTYTTDTETITFTTDTYCKATNAEQGTYAWTHENGELTLKMRSDTCTDRIGVLDGVVYEPLQ